MRTGKFTPPPPAPEVEPPQGAPAGTPLPETPTKPAAAQAARPGHTGAGYRLSGARGRARSRLARQPKVVPNHSVPGTARMGTARATWFTAGILHSTFAAAAL